MNRLIACTATAAFAAIAACSEPVAAKPEAVDTATPTAVAPAAPVIPEAVNGWREYPLRDGVISLQAEGKWRTDVIDVPVKAGEDLEYKLDMKKGQGVVYNITYGDLEHPGMMEVEFHGHTEKDASGAGDLMFYSKTGGSPESGVFTAPWDGIHGWYLKNDSAKDVVVRLELAGFYALEAK
ncbi:MAG: hypothetical protein Q8R82_06570 [Hyphomonadaceae bacterium]|nr:hypothetical protein [Hyphomonadaceae bacterium]